MDAETVYGHAAHSGAMCMAVVGLSCTMVWGTSWGLWLHYPYRSHPARASSHVCHAQRYPCGTSCTAQQPVLHALHPGLTGAASWVAEGQAVCEGIEHPDAPPVDPQGTAGVLREATEYFSDQLVAAEAAAAAEGRKKGKRGSKQPKR